ncbi:MAG: radical SAM protein [Nanoarchaeota archaeon]
MSYLKHIAKIFSKKMSAPNSLVFFITNKCNAKCAHCFYWKDLNNPKKPLTLEEIEKISRNLDDLVLLVLTGGEPFLRMDIVDIVKIFHKNNHVKNLVIPTNGYFDKMIAERVEKILEECKGLENLQIYISLDDEGERHDTLRGVKGIFEKAKETHKKLTELKKKHDNLNVGILLTVNPMNQDRIMEVYDYIKKEVDPDVISPILMRKTSDKLNSTDVKVENYEKFKAAVTRDMIKKQFRKRSTSLFSRMRLLLMQRKMELIVRTVKGGYQLPCFAGNISGVLNEYGDVYPCEILNKKMGNVKDVDYDLKRIWKSKKAKDVRKFIKDTNCHCTYECAMDSNITFNYKMMSKIFLKSLFRRF